MLLPGTLSYRSQHNAPLHLSGDLDNGDLAHSLLESMDSTASEHTLAHQSWARSYAQRSFNAVMNLTSRWADGSSAWLPLGRMSTGKWQPTWQLRNPNATGYPNATGANMSNRSGSMKEVLMALAGGTGASPTGFRNSRGSRDMLRRMQYQDRAVMFLVAAVYVVVLWFIATLTFRHASNNSPVTYYSDPRSHDLVMEGHDLDAFLYTFNQPPKNIALQVTGFEPVPDDVLNSIRWNGENLQTVFTFSLDLSPWVQQATHTIATPAGQQVRTLHDGVLPEHRSIVHHLLTHDQNDLTYVELVKDVDWPGWEELATNIKHQIRQSGFNGIITVHRVETDEVYVYKNKSWANFMHARATRVLCALSLVGWMFYAPYMWLRCKKVSVHSHYRVDISIAEYWRLIEGKLTEDGFLDSTRTVPNRRFN